MSDLFRDVFELALRLEHLREAPLRPLRLAHHDRDGPQKGHGPMPAPKRTDGPHTAPRPRSWNWKSKGT